mgnify:CR=1 FL=1
MTDDLCEILYYERKILYTFELFESVTKHFRKTGETWVDLAQKYKFTWSSGHTHLVFDDEESMLMFIMLVDW